MNWRERVAERTVAFGMGHERLYRVGAGAARLLQTPMARDGQLNLPEKWNPAQDRHLPALAARSFREIWQSGELEDGRTTD